LESENHNDYDCDISFSEQVRVIPCKGVDGVEFGDSIEEVQAKLGTSNFALGWTDGLYRGWRSINYNEGHYAGLDISFLIKEDGATPGPVDMFIIESPYQGKTREGIGLGSSLVDVKRTYGTPAYIDRGNSRDLYTYCFGEQHLNVGIRADSVFGMSIGYHIPMPEGETQYCQ
jgi:hypothetical protein